MTSEDLTRRLTARYDALIAEHGVTPAGVGWFDPQDLVQRFEVMVSGVDWSGVSAERPLRLLDVGCGPGFMLDFLAAKGLLDRIAYTGVDISDHCLTHARRRWPAQTFALRDIVNAPYPPATFDYAILCGTFTSRFDLSYAEMEAHTKSVLRAAFACVSSAIAFNTISKHVDWERDDLFHWPLDSIMAFCKVDLSRHVALRSDYGVREFTTIVRREPLRLPVEAPSAWQT